MAYLFLLRLCKSFMKILLSKYMQILSSPTAMFTEICEIYQVNDFLIKIMTL